MYGLYLYVIKKSQVIHLYKYTRGIIPKKTLWIKKEHEADLVYIGLLSFAIINKLVEKS